MKKTIQEFRDYIQKHFQMDAEIDYVNTPNEIHIWHNMYWGADNERDYVRQERTLNKLHYESKLFDMWCWCDSSGYEYWMLKQREPNYVSIDIVVHKPELTDKEFTRIISKLDDFDRIINHKMNQYDTNL